MYNACSLDFHFLTKWPNALSRDHKPMSHHHWWRSSWRLGLGLLSSSYLEQFLCEVAFVPLASRGWILPTLSVFTNPPLKWDTLTLCLFPFHKKFSGLLHNGLPWLFAEHSLSVPHFGFRIACLGVSHSPLRCGYVCSGCTILWAEFIPWHLL